MPWQKTDIQRHTGFHPLLCKRLYELGVRNEASLDRFLRPKLSDLYNPFLMHGMSRATARLDRAIRKKERIRIYGDYDVDGATGVALLSRFLTPLSPQVDYYIPDRISEGYGFSEKGLSLAIEDQVDLLILVDCGIRASEYIRKAKQNGIDCIVCDHHQVEGTLPPAIILNPKQAACDYPEDALSGCAIAFKLAQAYTQQHQLDTPALWRLLDLVAMSLACDLVQLKGENRTLMHLGLRQINEEESTTGIQALIAVSKKSYPLSVSDLVFYIGPLLNAAGRLAHAKDAVNLLLNDDGADAFLQAQALFDLNEKRRELTEKMMQEALQQWPLERDSKTIVLYQKDWPPGILGILAARATELYKRPAIALSQVQTEIKGSARSVSGFQLYHSLLACEPLLASWGGHKQAAGLTLKAGTTVEDFRMHWEREAANFFMPDETNGSNAQVLGEIRLSEVGEALSDQIKALAPYGPGHMQPLFLAKDVYVTKEPLVLKEKHLRLQLTQDDSNTPSCEAIAFYAAENKPHWQAGKKADIVFAIDDHTWRDRRRIQLQLRQVSFREKLNQSA